MSDQTINPIRRAWEAGKKNSNLQKSAKSSSVKKPKKIELKLREPSKDYQKMLELLFKTKSSAIMTNIKELINTSSLDFSWLNYNHEKEADETDYWARINGPLEVLGLESIASMALACGKVGPPTVIVTAVVGLSASIYEYKADISEVYSKYTEPQKELLEKLVLYRKIIKLIDPKAKYILLKDFENFVKYVNFLKK